VTIEIGCGQITWRGSGDSEDQVLADIAAAEYAGAPWPRGESDATAIAQRFSRHGLKPAPGYFAGDFWDRSRRDEQLAQARSAAEISRRLGLTEIYLADNGFDRVRPGHRTRRQAAGNVTEADSLSDQEFEQLAEGVSEVGFVKLEDTVVVTDTGWEAYGDTGRGWNVFD